MKCPKCGEEMVAGEIAYINAKGRLFWAPESYFKKKISNWYTKRNVLKNDGMVIPIGNGFTSNRTKGYVCRKCDCVLMCFD